MKLKDELGLNEDFKHQMHEALLNIMYTGDSFRKRAREFFFEYGITDVQFNLISLLNYQTKNNEGLTQAELSRMLLVNRSNITTLIDRMEKADLVMRGDVPGDRRYNSIKLTPHGKKVLANVEKKYVDEVNRIMGVLSSKERINIMDMLGRIRGNL